MDTRTEDLERVTAFAEQLGLPFECIVGYWLDGGKLEFDKLLQKKSEMENLSSKIEIGYYAFEGGKFSPDPKTYPNLQGVVAWLNPDPNAPVGKRGLILMPDAMLKLWADKNCETGIGDEEDGKTNTRRLIAWGKKHGISFPAAEWCYRYSQNGVKPGDGFLPAKNQLKRIVANRDIINSALKKIGGVILDGWIWSSSEYSTYYAWNVTASYGGVLYGPIKALYSFDVRCVLAF